MDEWKKWMKGKSLLFRISFSLGSHSEYYGAFESKKQVAIMETKPRSGEVRVLYTAAALYI